MESGVVIAVDFDGTLFVDNYPNIGLPIYEVINWCKKQKHNGNKLILWTCRSGKFLENAISACKDYGLIFDAINSNLPELIKLYNNDCRKVSADIYLDDKNINIFDIITNNKHKNTI